jgi:hypothetical protein
VAVDEGEWKKTRQQRKKEASTSNNSFAAPNGDDSGDTTQIQPRTVYLTGAY